MQAKCLYAMIFGKPGDWDFSGRRLAKESSNGFDALNRAIHELEEHGLLVRSKLPTGKTKWKLCEPNAENQNQEPDSENPKLGKPLIGKTSTISNTKKKVRLKESNALPRNEEATDLGFKLYDDHSDSKEGIKLGELSERIVELWNKQQGLRKCQVFSQGRKKSLNARIKDAWWLQNWQKGIELVSQSSFCTGENDRNWKADIEWFLRPDSLVNIIEGKYGEPERIAAPSSAQNQPERWKAAASAILNDPDCPEKLLGILKATDKWEQLTPNLQSRISYKLKEMGHR